MKYYALHRFGCNVMAAISVWKEGEKGTSYFVKEESPFTKTSHNSIFGVNSFFCLFWLRSILLFSSTKKCLRLVTVTTCRRCSRTVILFESRGIFSAQDRSKTICFGLETFQNRALTELPSQNSEQRY